MSTAAEEPHRALPPAKTSHLWVASGAAFPAAHCPVLPTSVPCPSLSSQLRAQTPRVSVQLLGWTHRWPQGLCLDRSTPGSSRLPSPLGLQPGPGSLYSPPLWDSGKLQERPTSNSSTRLCWPPQRIHSPEATDPAEPCRQPLPVRCAQSQTALGFESTVGKRVCETTHSSIFNAVEMILQIEEVKTFLKNNFTVFLFLIVATRKF